MERRLWLFAITSLVGCPVTATAVGINLGWNDCPSGAGYALTEAFACNTNVGTHTLVGSFVAPAGVDSMSANEIVIDMMTSGATFADWWSMRAPAPSGCRAFSLRYSFDFTGGPATCTDYWQGAASGAINMEVPGTPYQQANRSRIKVLAALPVADPHIRGVPEGTEVYSFKAIIDNAKTVGLGACGGCSDEACIVVSSLTIYQPVAVLPSQIRMYNPATVLHVLWQGWSNPDPQMQCPAVVPAKTRTWGSIKALYR